MIKVTEVTIISGFLGAGKTTLIKKLLKEVYDDEQVVLIENELVRSGSTVVFCRMPAWRSRR